MFRDSVRSIETFGRRKGFCKTGDKTIHIKLRLALREERGRLSGENSAPAPIFMGHLQILGCIFCQNYSISPYWWRRFEDGRSKNFAGRSCFSTSAREGWSTNIKSLFHFRTTSDCRCCLRAILVASEKKVWKLPNRLQTVGGIRVAPICARRLLGWELVEHLHGRIFKIIWDPCDGGFMYTEARRNILKALQKTALKEMHRQVGDLLID